ncbi:MAG: phosphodiesterase [Vulcanimicrobiaceae bacterium]
MKAVTVAHISDLHIARHRAGLYRYSGSTGRLARCIAKLNALRPDLVIATGDLTHAGSAQEYSRLRELLETLEAPVYLLPGNHDNREALRQAFPDHDYLFATRPYIAYTIDAGEMRIIALDSTEPGRTGGYLDAPRLAWLRSRLEETARPTLLALHHPPFKTGVWPMDGFGFVNLDALGELIERYPHVRRIVSGHVHCVRTAQLIGTLACTSPAMTSHVLVRTAPWGPLSLTFERGGFLLHSCDGNDSIRTSVMRMNGRVEELPV